MIVEQLLHMNLRNNLLNILLRQLSTSLRTNTAILAHVYLPPKTPEGEHQRPPYELQNLQKYTLIANEYPDASPEIEVILLQDIEGIGAQFDVVCVDRRLARLELFPLQKACYASPFDLEYYALKKEAMKDELSKRLRIPYEFLKICRKMMSIVIPIYVSSESKWIINSEVLLASLNQAGVEVTEKSTLHLHADQAHSGPNLDLEAALIRFYCLLNNQMIIPVLGRILHSSIDDSKINLYPNHSKMPSDEQLERLGMPKENFYFHPTPTLNLDVKDIANFMRSSR